MGNNINQFLNINLLNKNYIEYINIIFYII